IAGLLSRQGVPAAWLKLEITESGLVPDPERVMGVLARLHGLGVRIGIDDLGVGFSRLSYLRGAVVDEVKIDRSLVGDMARDAHAAAIVRAGVTLGHDLGLTVTAEGVEDQPTWERLVAFGCDLAQGTF